MDDRRIITKKITSNYQAKEDWVSEEIKVNRPTSIPTVLGVKVSLDGTPMEPGLFNLEYLINDEWYVKEEKRIQTKTFNYVHEVPPAVLSIRISVLPPAGMEAKITADIGAVDTTLK